MRTAGFWAGRVCGCSALTLPPLTLVNSSVTVAGGLEPAYEVAGGSLDDAVDAGVARFAVFDGMGHGIVSAQLISLVVAAYRNARCAGQWRSRNQTTAVTTGMVTKWVM